MLRFVKGTVGSLSEGSKDRKLKFGKYEYSFESEEQVFDNTKLFKRYKMEDEMEVKMEDGSRVEAGGMAVALF